MVTASALLLVYGIATLGHPQVFSVMLVGIALLVSSGRYRRQASVTVVGLAAAVLVVVANSFPEIGSALQSIVVALLWVAVFLLGFGRWIFKRY